MEYKADFGLINLIDTEVKRLVRNVLLGLFLFIAGSLIIFIVEKQIVDFLYIFCECVFFIIMAYLQYSQIIPSGLIVNNTVIELTVETDRILTKTSPFKVLFWINKPSKEVVFIRSELKVRQVPYPVKAVFDLGNRVIKLADSEKEVYIIVDYFDNGLKEKLMSLKDESSQ